MTEIVRTTSTTVTTDILLSKSTIKAKTVEHVVVRSFRSNRLDVAVVQAFARALDQAQAPGRAQVEAHRSDVGHLIQLTAKWETEIAQPEPPAAPPFVEVLQGPADEPDQLDRDSAAPIAPQHHGYTNHGHACCGYAILGEEPPIKARCGGAGLCKACQRDLATIHAGGQP